MLKSHAEGGGPRRAPDGRILGDEDDRIPETMEQRRAREERERKRREKKKERRRERAHEEREERRPRAEGEADGEEESEVTFRFPIIDVPAALGNEVKMKNIPPSVLPNFYGSPSEDPDAFLFEFDILCRTYGYTDDAHKLCLFPATLKGSALKWFMGLGEKLHCILGDNEEDFPQEISGIL
jgi:hypothetical protein